MDNTICIECGSKGSGTQPDFGFAFDNSKFSDAILMIEVVPDLPELKTGNEDSGVSVVVDLACKRKRRREEINTRLNGAYLVMQHGKQKVNCNVLEMDDGLADEEREKEAVGRLEESSSGIVMATNLPGDDEASKNDNSSTNMDSSNPLHMRTVHISSPILAAKSLFFYKLFSNGIEESEQRQVTIRIHASEEAALMDLLKYMYSNVLSTTTPTGLLDVLMVADKFEVASCMRHCSRLLRIQHMTTESALFYLDLPSNKSMVDSVRPLTNAAKQFLAKRFKDITKFPEEVLGLPLSGIEAVLSSDKLQIASEDDVYDFALKWARMHYPKLEKRREVWTSHLFQLIRIPFMTCKKLKKVRTCHDFDPELASKLVFEALLYKAEASYGQRAIAAEAGNALNHWFVEREYKFKPVKTLEFETPRQQCIVYLDLKRDECAILCPAGRVYSQAFHLGGQEFFLSARCEMDQHNAFHCFGLYIGMQEKATESFAVDYEFAARVSPGEEYVSMHNGNNTFTSGLVVGCRNLFGVSWSALLNGDSLFFINGILHLRAELTVRQ